MIRIFHKPKTFKLTESAIKENVSKIYQKIAVQEPRIVNIVFLSKNEIQKINKKYRKKDKPTDTLSFRYSENEIELFFCIDMMGKGKSDKYFTVKKEFLMLIIHGILHTLGYTHRTKIAKGKMFQLQQNLLSFVHDVKVEK